MNNLYEPARVKEGLNPHLVRAGIIWLSVTVVCLIGGLIALSEFPSLVPRDPHLMVRIVLEKVVGQVAGVFFGSGILLFYELVTNGNLLGRVLQEPRASSIFLVGVLACSTLIFCFV